jgi:DNA-binding CsgD family transcriptional regulator
MFLSFDRTRSLSKVMSLLAGSDTTKSVRAAVVEEVLRLVEADYSASYVWDPVSSSFGDRVSVNMNESNLWSYETYYQFRDPITHQLQQRRSATLVEQILPQDQLIKTEFFNDFLLQDGLYWGVNLFAWDGERNIGDMRIWRKKARGCFDHETLELLELIRPGFVSALARCQRGLCEETAGPIQPIYSYEKLPCLSPRELDVADLLAQGLSDKAIAQKLGLSFSTVRTHITHIFAKLGAENRVQLAARLASVRRVAR